jgi:hypothetical protein
MTDYQDQYNPFEFFTLNQIDQQNQSNPIYNFQKTYKQFKEGRYIQVSSTDRQYFDILQSQKKQNYFKVPDGIYYEFQINKICQEIEFIINFYKIHKDDKKYKSEFKDEFRNKIGLSLLNLITKFINLFVTFQDFMNLKSLKKNIFDNKYLVESILNDIPMLREIHDKLHDKLLVLNEVDHLMIFELYDQYIISIDDILNRKYDSVQFKMCKIYIIQYLLNLPLTPLVLIEFIIDLNNHYDRLCTRWSINFPSKIEALKFLKDNLPLIDGAMIGQYRPRQIRIEQTKTEIEIINEKVFKKLSKVKKDEYHELYEIFLKFIIESIINWIKQNGWIPFKYNYPYKDEFINKLSLLYINKNLNPFPTELEIVNLFVEIFFNISTKDREYLTIVETFLNILKVLTKKQLIQQRQKPIQRFQDESSFLDQLFFSVKKKANKLRLLISELPIHVY